VDPHLRRLQQQIGAAVADLSPQESAWHRPGKWCAAEIIEHLYLTYTATTKGFGRVLEAGQPLATVPTWRHRALALVVVGLRHMPAGREAPRVVRPRGIPAEKVMSEIILKISEMDEVMALCEKKFGPRRKVLDHPLLGPFSIDQWRKFHLVHGMHHVKQIHRLRDEMSGN
jgi:uncharacterized protein DUF1569